MSRFEQFFEWISDPTFADPSESTREMERAFPGLDARVKRVVSGSRPGSRDESVPAWVKRARNAQAEFERRFQATAAWVAERYRSSGELIQAIQDGSLGLGVQNHAQVFFRHKDLTQLSDSDLRSFIADCEALELLEGDSL